MAGVAIYARVSTKEQATANQIDELRAWAARAGHEVVMVYEDKGISGAKGRDKRPGFDVLLKGTVRREFDIIAVWSSDRLGRSMPHLLDVLQTIRMSGRERPRPDVRWHLDTSSHRGPHSAFSQSTPPFTMCSTSNAI